MISVAFNARTPLFGQIKVRAAVLASPVIVMFLASNFANAGNLLFNVVFSRWMGPELFGQLAMLLTIKLALLAVLGALQMSVAQVVATEAGTSRQHIAEAIAGVNRVMTVAMIASFGLILPLSLAPTVTAALGLQSAAVLPVLVLSLPFMASLVTARGMATGRMNVGQLALSSNGEMLVRLLGGALAWQAGWGIEGVVLAIVASIIVGWLAVRPSMARAANRADWPLLRRLLMIALPFGALQLAQVILLDGDVFFGRAFLSAEDAGNMAALSLVQRVQFFSCFGLSAVLLPAVARAATVGISVFRTAQPVALVFVGVTVLTLSALCLAPETVIAVMVGPAFAGAAPVLPLAGLAAALFTLSYLVATYLAALGDRRGIWAVLALVPVQLGAFYLLGTAEQTDLATLLIAKTACQAALSALLLAMAVFRTRQTGVQVKAPQT